GFVAPVFGIFLVRGWRRGTFALLGRLVAWAAAVRPPPAPTTPAPWTLFLFRFDFRLGNLFRRFADFDLMLRAGFAFRLFQDRHIHVVVCIGAGRNQTLQERRLGRQWLSGGPRLRSPHRGLRFGSRRPRGRFFPSGGWRSWFWVLGYQSEFSLQRLPVRRGILFLLLRVAHGSSHHGWVEFPDSTQHYSNSPSAPACHPAARIGRSVGRWPSAGAP